VLVDELAGACPDAAEDVFDGRPRSVRDVVDLSMTTSNEG
jgi:hypothetical protein